MEQLYYISQGKNASEHLQNIQAVCEAGVRLVQLRLKDVPQEEYNQVAKKANEICAQFGATLVINDNVEAAIYSNAKALHLGKTDMPPSEARKLCPEKIIGGTANTIEDCLRLVNEGVDYIGMGPFRFTTTKSNLEPVLGAEGYQKIIQKLREKGIDTPVYAIGGIEVEDIPQIAQTGVFGVCMSGYLTGENLQEKVKKIKTLL